jgi:hypothetical protein
MMSTELKLALLPMPLLAGCNGAFWGNLVVVGITVGIFFGTLSLGRAGASTIRSAPSSASNSAP